MKAFQFDNAGFYLGETVADESPLEPGVYLLPARCTFTAPPKNVPQDKRPRWNGVCWTLANKPQAAADGDPVAKLAAFLANNPDVAAMLNNQGGANV